MFLINGSVVMGQNYDSPQAMGGTMSWVLHKVGDEALVFAQRSGACPALPMIKNEYGLAITVSMIETTLAAPPMKPRFVRLREAMASCKTAEEAYRIVFEKDRFPFSLNLLIGDPTKIVAVQILPEEIRPTFVKKTVVQSNDFDYYDWLPKMRRPGYSTERQQYAEKVWEDLSRTKEKITDADLLDVLRDSPVICRDQEAEKSATVSFMTMESFGNGNARGPVGRIPI